MQFFSSAKFFFKECIHVVINHVLKREMLRLACLNKYLPEKRAPSRAAGNLRQELECSFRCSEVGEEHLGVGGDNADKCHARKIQSFCHHLCSEEDVCASVPECPEDPLV